MKEITKEIKDQIMADLKALKSLAEGPKMKYLAKATEAYEYERGEKPGKTFANEELTVFPYVYPAVREAVKEALPIVYESFITDGKMITNFRSLGFDKRTELNDILAYNINRVLLERQNVPATIKATMKECLNPGSAFIKTYYDESTDRDVEIVDDWAELADFVAWLGQTKDDGWMIDPPAEFATQNKGKVDGFQWKKELVGEGDQQSVSIQIKGRVKLKNENREINVDFVEAKDLWFDTSHGHDFDKSRFQMHRILTTVGEAEKKGYDPKILANAALNDKELLIPDLSAGDDWFDNNELDPKERKIYLYDWTAYTSRLNDEEESELWQFISTENEILDQNPITVKPIIHAKREIIPGHFFGRGFFEEAKPLQIQLTKKARQADRAADQNMFHKYLAIKGQYNRESLLNNRPGAIVEQMAAGSVDVFPNHPLDASFPQSYEILRDDERQILRRGFGSANLEEIPPLATATVAMGVYKDAQRCGLITNTIADTLMIPLVKNVYEIMRELYNAGKWTLYDLDGQPIKERLKLPTKYEIKIDINTKDDDLAQNLLAQSMVDNATKLAAINASWLSDQNKYEFMNLLGKSGDLRIDKLLTDPQSVDNSHQQQAQMVSDAVQEQLLQMQPQTAELEQWKLGAEIYKLTTDANTAIMKTNADIQISSKESLANIQKIVMEARNKSDANRVKASEVVMKSDLGDKEYHLGLIGHAKDITAPSVNGVR
ncbi:TPA: portal protein [Escherichia coli]